MAGTTVFWTGLIALTALAVALVLRPLIRRAETVTSDAGDQAIYRDQLAEIDRDRAAGLIGAPEAEAARAEVARRLLKAAASVGEPAGRAALSPLAIVAIIASLPLVATLVYMRLGQPGLPDQPLAARLALPADKLSPQDILARAEAKLVANPDDGPGWDVIGRVYYRLGRFEDAATAARNAIRLLNPSLERQLLLGQAVFFANEGVITAEAREAFESALRIEPANVLARMYLALALDQEGRRDDSIAAWRSLRAGAKGDEPWLEVVDGQIARLEGREPPAKASAPAPAAPPADGGLSPEQKQMVNDMVGRLAERLNASGGSAEDWAKLMRSYLVLGRADDARAAYARARDAVKDDAAQRAALDEAAKNLGLQQ